MTRGTHIDSVKAVESRVYSCIGEKNLRITTDSRSTASSSDSSSLVRPFLTLHVALLNHPLRASPMAYQPHMLQLHEREAGCLCHSLFLSARRKVFLRPEVLPAFIANEMTPQQFDQRLQQFDQAFQELTVTNAFPWHALKWLCFLALRSDDEESWTVVLICWPSFHRYDLCTRGSQSRLRKRRCLLALPGLATVRLMLACYRLASVYLGWSAGYRRDKDAHSRCLTVTNRSRPCCRFPSVMDVLLQPSSN